MSANTDISGSFQRPGLVDYIIVAENLRLDVELRLWIGALEVGLVGIAGGQVFYAEIPGATGDTALGLLARLPARVTPEAARTRESNVQAAWREVIDERAMGASAGRLQRLEAVRSELAELASESAGEAVVAAVVDGDETDARARRGVAELLDWAAVEAYLGGDVERARLVLIDRERIQPGDLLCAANLERLRLRLLEDEIEACVTGAAS